MSVLALLTELKQRGITVEAHGDRLRFRPRSAAGPELLAAMGEHKGELLAILSPSPESPAIPRPEPGETIVLITGHPLADFVWPDAEPDDGRTGSEILRNHAIARDRLDRTRFAIE